MAAKGGTNGHLDEKFGVEHYVMSRAFVSSCHF